MSGTHHVNLTASHATNYFVTWTATVPMVTVSLVALVANGTVLVMFAVRPSLRRGKNAYIASLALADFLIGCYMPLVALEEVGLVKVWPGALCSTYLTVRYSLLYVSLLSILFITLDRWWSLRWPFSYRTRHSRRLAAYLISGVWALSLLLYTLPIFLWDASGPRSSSSLDADDHSSNHHQAGAGVKISHSNQASERSAERARSSEAGFLLRPRASRSVAARSEEEECEVPYALSFTWSALTCCVLYVLPLCVMWVINCSLYHKIRHRQSVEVRRSTSVTDTFFVTVKNSKPTIHITEAPSLAAPPSCTDLPSPGSPLLPLRSASASPTHTHTVPLPTPQPSSPSHCQSSSCHNLHPGYVTPNMGRRHSSAVVTLTPQLDVRRQFSQRRVSLPDWALRGQCSPSSANNSDQCRYVGRKWSGCGGSSTPLGQGGLGLGSSTGLFPSTTQLATAGRNHGEHLVHELLVKQDQKAACCLALLLAACTVCWLPFAFLSLLRAHCPPCVTGTALAVCRWLLLANSAINPFLYGLLNTQFRNILRQWFYLDTSRRYRPRDTYIYMGVTRQDGPDSAKDNSHICLNVKAP